MLSVKEAAEKLGVSGARVRAMLKSGQIEGQKIGNAWVIAEASIASRIQSGSHPGRPPANRCSVYERPIPDVDEAHRIFDDAKRVLSGCYNATFLDQARSQEEQAFWLRVADFFLQQKQQELIEKGVF